MSNWPLQKRSLLLLSLRTAVSAVTFVAIGTLIFLARVSCVAQDNPPAQHHDKTLALPAVAPDGKAQDQRCWSDEPHGGKMLRKVPLPKDADKYICKSAKRSSLGLKLCINEKGDVVKAIVLVGTGCADLDNAVATAALTAKFEPCIRNGKAVPSVVHVALFLRPH